MHTVVRIIAEHHVEHCRACEWSDFSDRLKNV